MAIPFEGFAAMSNVRDKSGSPGAKEGMDAQATSAGRLAKSSLPLMPSHKKVDGKSSEHITEADGGKSMYLARRRSVDNARRSFDGRGVPMHDYQRSKSSDEDEADLNNENLPKSTSVEPLGDVPDEGHVSSDRRFVQFSADRGPSDDDSASPGEAYRRVSAEENNLISHLARSSSQSNMSMMSDGRGSGRPSGERRSSTGQSSVDISIERELRRSVESVKALSGTSSARSSAEAKRALTHSTLYLGNLHPYVTDADLRGLFASFEGIVELKIIKDRATGMSAGYGFARFQDVELAAVALQHIKNQTVFGQQIKASWALQKDKEDELGSHHHVFVGDLSQDVTDVVLKAAFSHLDGCSDARVMWDHGSGRSKGYGFVSFVTKEQAKLAIEGMDGAYVGTRCIRCGWAKHKTDAAVPADPNILDQTDPTNTNIYIGNLPGDLSIAQAREEFSKYGIIVEVKLHRKGNYGFVRYQTHAEAIKAIVGLNSGRSFGGVKLKCSWGRHPLVPPSGVKAQLIMAAATSGTLPQPNMMQSAPSMMQPAPNMVSSFMQSQPHAPGNIPLQGYNIMPSPLGMMGNMGPTMMGAPDLNLSTHQMSPTTYPISQMQQLPPMPQMDGLSVEAVVESMVRMGFYGNQMAMPQNPSAQVDHAMASGFYRSGNGGYGSYSSRGRGYRYGQDGMGRKHGSNTEK